MTNKVIKPIAVLLAAVILLSVLPLTASAAEAGQSVAEMSGTTGGCAWSLDDNGLLTISRSGNGKMPDYYEYIIEYYVEEEGQYFERYVYNMPWYDYRNQIKSVVINSGVEKIGDNAFRDCINVASIDIPDSVNEIGEAAFISCRSLTEIEIPYGVTILKNCLFAHCSSLAEVTLPDSLNVIYNSAFGSCTGLVSFTVPDSVTEIGTAAFSGCKNLTGIYIPKSVTAIGRNAFEGCKNLTIFGALDSYAYTYAKANNIRFVYEKSGTTGECSWAVDES